jgi:hypothetical protein
VGFVSFVRVGAATVIRGVQWTVIYVGQGGGENDPLGQEGILTHFLPIPSSMTRLRPDSGPRPVISFINPKAAVRVGSVLLRHLVDCMPLYLLVCQIVAP